jgi:hypothetical protein
MLSRLTESDISDLEIVEEDSIFAGTLISARKHENKRVKMQIDTVRVIPITEKISDLMQQDHDGQAYIFF